MHLPQQLIVCSSGRGASHRSPPRQCRSTANTNTAHCEIRSHSDGESRSFALLCLGSPLTLGVHTNYTTTHPSFQFRPKPAKPHVLAKANMRNRVCRTTSHLIPNPALRNAPSLGQTLAVDVLIFQPELGLRSSCTRHKLEPLRFEIICSWLAQKTQRTKGLGSCFRPLEAVIRMLLL